MSGAAMYIERGDRMRCTTFMHGYIVLGACCHDRAFALL